MRAKCGRSRRVGA